MSKTVRLTELGTKDKQLNSDEDRMARYRRWRWTFGDGCYVSDVDHIEWAFEDGKPKPLAIMELTRADKPGPISDWYLNKITDRYNRQAQGRMALHVAAALGVPAFIVLMRQDLTEFWRFCLTRPNGWDILTKVEYESWIRRMRNPDWGTEKTNLT